MPVCEICGLDSAHIHECTQCKSGFCDECGDVEKGICFDCLGWSEVNVEDTFWSEDEFN